MQTLFYLHYNEQELLQRIEPLVHAGYKVVPHFKTSETARFETLPDVFILSLDRLPSHAKAYAQWIRQAKKRQHLPLVFVGGQEEKTAAFREMFPGALFCESRHLLTLLNQLK